MAFIEKIKKDGIDYMAEELFQLKRPLHEVNPTCLNTVRIFTLNDDKNSCLMCTSVRFGGDKGIVDNGYIQ